jgi:uncharacterized Tic20 family protein
MSVHVESEYDLSKDVRMWGMFCHISALVGLLGNGFGFVLGPLIIWLAKREDHPFIDDQGKEALNFQITMFLAFVISFLLAFVVIGFFLLAILVVMEIALPIIGAIKANNGEYYRYPFTLRLIK